MVAERVVVPELEFSGQVSEVRVEVDCGVRSQDRPDETVALIGGQFDQTIIRCVH
jgi:hypothetical protein